MSSYKTCEAAACGSYTSCYCCNNLAGTYCFETTTQCGGRYCGPYKTYYNSCATSACGVKSYKSCRDDDCGVERYKLCRHSQCGVEEYNSCYHYRSCDKLS